jgi:amidophosphoribosyltransferase
MGGLFGVVSKEDCVLDLFFGIDYHSHLGTVKGGMATIGERGFTRVIHNIQNSPFRTKFENDLDEMAGNSGIGCISDTDSQPLVVKSHLGDYSLCCVGRINNVDELLKQSWSHTGVHLLEGSRGHINSTELVALLIDQCDSFTEGVRRVHELVEGSMSLLILTKDGIIAARDKNGRTPLIIAQKDGAVCAASESFSYLTLGYHTVRELGPGEIVRITPEGVELLSPPQEEMKMCAFLWTYYGYPSSVYEGVSVEDMRYRCGEYLAKQDGDLHLDAVAGVPDSGIAHAIGYANASGTKFARPFIKYTPTWPRSFTPKDQRQRNLIARMKLIPVEELIRDRELLFIDDSIVRGTQLRETVEFLYDYGAKAVHIRPACPPVMFSCKYLSFSRSTSEMELYARRTIQELEGNCDRATIDRYLIEDGPEYKAMVAAMCNAQKFSSLGFLKLADLVSSITIPREKLCTYCWNGQG